MLKQIRVETSAGEIVELCAEVESWLDNRGREHATAVRTSLNGHRQWIYTVAYRDSIGPVFMTSINQTKKGTKK